CMSTPGAVFRTRKSNQTSSSGKCRSAASRQAISLTRGCISSPCRHWANPVGRLESLSDTARTHESVAHTNSHHHRNASRCCLSRCIRSWSLYTRRAQALSAELGTAFGTQCQCSTSAEHEASPVRHSDCLCSISWPSCRLDAELSAIRH